MFEIDENKCIHCGQCIRDCSIKALKFNDKQIPEIDEKKCFKCQHCLAVCPVGALSVCDKRPENSDRIYSQDPEMILNLIKSRRSVRHYKKENVSQEKLQKLKDMLNYVPTGVNFHKLHFAFIDDISVTHRTDVTALMTDDTLDEWDEIIHESRHTRYPVCDGSTDNVIGILNAKDYFRIADRTKEKVLEEAVHPAYFVPETIKADVLFRDMKNTRNSLAVVLDEYGGMVGIITLNDLIEELVGELNDEPADPENEDPHIEKIDDTSWRVIGNVELCDLEEETGVELASDDYDTLTGLVFDKLGMIPVDGPQNITIELDKLTVHIDKIESHQIDSAVITLKPSEEMDENEE